MLRKAVATAVVVAGSAVLLAGQAAAAAALDPSVAPGGNFDLSHWELQLPIGSPGSPTVVSPADLQGSSGFQDDYFYTDPNDGSMTFWDPEDGVTYNESNYPRSELREMNPDGSALFWQLPGTHQLSATVEVEQVPHSVCVGQVHLDPNSGSTKPLLELYYHNNGDIYLGVEQSPDGGQTGYYVDNVPLGTQWSYQISITGGDTIGLSINGGTPQTWAIPSSFDGYGMYFKAGDYDQTAGDDSSVGGLVHFYALDIAHS